jgi:hypothetical protein
MERSIEAAAAVRADIESVCVVMRDPAGVLKRRGTSGGNYVTEMVVDLHDGTTVRQEVLVDIGLIVGDSRTGFRCRLAWRAVGRGRLLPAFEGLFEAAGDVTGGSALRISGSYHPPLGPLGALADAVALQGVAKRTLGKFTRELATAIDAAADRRHGDAWSMAGPVPDDMRPTPSEQWIG